MTAADVLLSLRGLSKTFQGQRALADVDLEVRSGEVHALLGQNGSGKSTLIKILAGYHRPDPGSAATVAGRPLELGSAPAARAAGIRFIHQDLGVIPEFDAVDNLALGRHYTGRAWLSDRAERRAAQELLTAYGVDVDVSVPLEALSAAQRTMVAIVRAVDDMADGRGLLVLDEPTASLPDHEVHQLFDLVGELRSRGASVLYVTHRLGEVFALADRVTVLRDGGRAATVDVDTLDHDGLVELIVGRPLSMFYPEPSTPRDEVALAVSGLVADGIDDVAFRAGRGEVVGVTGLVGSGYDQLLGTTFGARRRWGGSVVVGGTALPDTTPRAAIAAGVAFAPADRKRLSVIADWTARENVTLPRIPWVGALRWLSTRRERRDVDPFLALLDVVPADGDRLTTSFSGGNQQKIVLARWLRCGASVFLLEEPTNGVDTGAKQAIYQALHETAAAGAAVVLSSSDLEELCAVCDRVLVMRDGRVAAELDRADLTVERLLTECISDNRRTGEPVGAEHGRD